MRNIEQCPVCGSKSRQEFLPATFSGGVTEAAQLFRASREVAAHGRIVRCGNCSFAFTTPQFLPDEYRDIYIQSGMHPVPDQMLAEAELYRGRRLAALVQRFIDHGRLLDFGCGRGGFLSAAEGFERTGFEVAFDDEPPPMVAVFSGDFLEKMGQAPFLTGYFDVITAFDVLEHLAELDEYVAALASILRPGGIFVVSVPNVDSLVARLSGRRWNSFLLEHLWYFSPNTLKRFMAKHGLHEVQRGRLPYGASLNHVCRRIAQTYPVLRWMGRIPIGKRLILPVPAGLIYGIFAKADKPHA